MVKSINKKKKSINLLLIVGVALLIIIAVNVKNSNRSNLILNAAPVNNTLSSDCSVNPMFLTELDHQLLNCKLHSRIYSPLTYKFYESIDFKECGSYGYDVNWVKDLKNIKYDKDLKALRLELYSSDPNNDPRTKDLLSVKFTKFSNLEFLDISSNYIDSVPNSIFSLSNLKILKISCSNIKVLPDLFEKLTKLERLIINFSSELTKVPKTIKYLKELQSLEISSFKGDSLPFQLNNFQELKDLRISLNAELSEAIDLTSNPNLESILLTSNNLGIKSLYKLRHLVIYSPINLSEIEEISKLTKLEELSIVVNDINDIAPLSTLPNLKFLRISIKENGNYILNNSFHFGKLDYLGIGNRNISVIDQSFLSHFDEIKYLRIWCKKELQYNEQELTKKGINYFELIGDFGNSPKKQTLTLPEYNLKIKKRNIH